MVEFQRVQATKEAMAPSTATGVHNATPALSIGEGAGAPKSLTAVAPPKLAKATRTTIADMVVRAVANLQTSISSPKEMFDGT